LQPKSALEIELRRFNVIVRAAYSSGLELDAGEVKGKPFGKPGTSRDAVDDAQPVIALRVVGDEHLHRLAVTRRVLDLRAGIREQLQLLLGGPPAALFLGLEVLRQLLGRAREVVAEIERLDVDRAHRLFRAAVP